MAQRVTLRKRTPYNTKSNRRRVVKTPGGRLVYQHLKKLATSPKCGDCGVALPGVSRLILFNIIRPSLLIDFLLRFPLYAPANTQSSQSVERRSEEHMAVAGAAIV